MSRRATIVVVLLVISGGVAAVTGYGPLAGMVGEPSESAGPNAGGDGGGEGGPGSSGSGGDSGDSSGSSGGGGESGGSGDDADSGGASSGDGDRPPFAIGVSSVEECGRTCRDVTLRITNQQGDRATGVTVVARMFAGKRTDDGDKLWQGSADIGSLAAGETVTITRRLKLGFADVAKVKNKGGWVTVRTVVSADEANKTIVIERNVT